MSLARSYSSLTTTDPGFHLSYAFSDSVQIRGFSETLPHVKLQPCGGEITSHLDDDRKGVIQAGGRDKGFRVDPTGQKIILKDTSIAEQTFYTSTAPELDKSIQSDWDGWRPKFHYSNIFVNEKGNRKATIALENLSAITDRDLGPNVHGYFTHPSVIDIKLGQRLYGSADSVEKIRRKQEKAVKSTSALTGVRLSGARIWDNDQAKYLEFTRKFGFESDPEGKNLQEMFNSLFPILPLGEGRRKELLSYSDGGIPEAWVKRIIDESVIPQIEKILKHVSRFKWRCYNSSLLIVIEGDRNRLETIMQSSESIENFTNVKMIDFASVEAADDPDQGLLKGLESTLELFKKLSNQLENRRESIVHQIIRHQLLFDLSAW